VGAVLAFVPAVGGVALGAAVARAYLARMTRLEDGAPSVVLPFLSTFGVWLLAEALGLSAVLAMGAYAVTPARSAPERMGARHRRFSYAVWEVAVFVLNVLAFVLVGLQLRGILARLDGQAGRYALFAAAVLAAAILVRVAWVMGYYAAARWTGRGHGFLVRHARHRHAGRGARPASRLPRARPDPVRLLLRGAGHPRGARADLAPSAVPPRPAAGRKRGECSHLVLHVVEAIARGRHRDAEQVAGAGRRLHAVRVDPLGVDLLPGLGVNLHHLAVQAVDDQQVAVRRHCHCHCQRTAQEAVLGHLPSLARAGRGRQG
jgi:hypothetical protein